MDEVGEPHKDLEVSVGAQIVDILNLINLLLHVTIKNVQNVDHL